MAAEDSGNETTARSPFAELLDIHSLPGSDGMGKASMTIQHKHLQEQGVVQGGIIVALADYAFHRAVASVLSPGQHAVTIELKTNFISPAREGELTATAQLISRGRRVLVGDVEVLNQEGTLIARCLGTYLALAQRT